MMYLFKKIYAITKAISTDGRKLYEGQIAKKIVTDMKRMMACSLSMI
ncbi:MAG: hypothetical protein CM15mP127_02670 [Gammaproteobacteria bacterium]|nr:MAG: hypothetical protein CM15mP127_02670 [Gammaproteobacteria bacterium]